MGNLSNLFISSSYQSLIHLGSDNTASATLVGLQDGLGNSIGIAVNTSGDLSISGSFTSSLQQGYVLVGNAVGKTIAVATSSLGSTTDLTSLNAFTASQNTKDSTLATYTGSNDTKWSNLGSQSGSFVTESETGSFARTNVSNTFTATQTINADLIVSGTINAYKINTTIESSSVIFSSGSNVLGDATSDTQTLNGTVIISGSQQVTGSIGVNGDINMINNSNLVTHHIKAQGSNGLELQTSAGTNIVAMGAGGGTQAAFVGAVTANSVSASIITGLGSPQAFSSSVDSKFATIGGLTGSFATTGSNTFIGNEIITGSLIVTGSAKGNIVALSITSNTASMNLNDGNYFSLTLAGTATTHITATNLTPGTTATLLITTGTNSSASLAPILLQPSGSSYSASNGSGKKDVLSIVSFETGSGFVVSTKNMI